MKKAITILAVLIVLVGAVFADVHAGATAVKVTTSVSNVEPVFVIKVGDVTSAVSTVIGKDETTGAETRTPVTTANATSAALAGDAYHITTNDLLNGAKEVTFDVHQTNATKAILKYQFTAKATDLVLYKYPDSTGTLVDNSGTTAHTAPAAAQRFLVNGGTDGEVSVSTFADGSLGATQAKYAGTTSAKTVEYLGTNVAANTKVTSFKCTWNQNADAVVGEYQGTVTLTIATV